MTCKELTLKRMGERLDAAMVAANVSRTSLATRLGVSRQAVAKWCNGQCMPSIVALQEICFILNLSADYLLFGAKR